MYLILGGDSAIGEALSKYWKEKGILFHSTTRKQELVSELRPFVDLEKYDLRGLNCNYDAVILCAGITKIHECEKDPIRTSNINVKSTFRIADKFSRTGSFVVLLSSNQVFSGDVKFAKPYDNKNPITQYGIQKSDVEDMVSKLQGYSILRLTKVIHSDLPLLKEWNKKLAKKEKITAFTDMFICPVCIENVVEKINTLVVDKKNGIYHCSGGKDISYYDYAVNYAKRHGFSESLICEGSYLDCYGITSIVPKNTCLSVTRIHIINAQV